MSRFLKASMVSIAMLLGGSACAQTATVKVPLCLQVQGNTKQYIPCTGVVPVDPQTGNSLSWYDLFSSIGGGGSGGGGVIVDAGAASSKAGPVQNADGTKIASDQQLINAVDLLNTISTKVSTLTTNVGQPVQKDGKLPAFASVPTVNIGSMPAQTVEIPAGIATETTLGTVATRLSSVLSTLQGTLTTNIGSIALPTGASTGAKQDTLNVAIGAPTDNAATTTDGTSTSLIAQSKQLVRKVQDLTTVVGTPFQAGGSIANTTFGATQSGPWSVTLGTGATTIGGINNTYFGARLQDATGAAFGTSANPIYVSGGGGGGGGSTPTGPAGTPNTSVVTVQGIAGATPLAVQNTAPLAAGTNAIGSITNTAFGISGTLPAFGATPTFNIGTAGTVATETTVGTLFKSGQSIGNTAFGISGTLPAFTATPTFNLGTAPTLNVNNLAAVTTNAPTYTTGTNAALSLTTTGALRVDTGTTAVTANIGTTNGLALNATTDSLFKAGQSIGNTAFGISGTLPAFASTPTVNIGTMPAITSTTTGAVTTTAPTYTTGTNANLSLTTTGALRVDNGNTAVTANIGTTNGLALDTTVSGLFKSGQNIGNTSFGISGTLPAFAATPTVNLGTIAGVATDTKLESVRSLLAGTLSVNTGATLDGSGNATVNLSANDKAFLSSIASGTKTVSKFAAMTVGTTYTVGTGIGMACTAAGNVVLAGSDGSQITIPVQEGYNQFAFGITRVVSQTATCTFTSLS